MANPIGATRSALTSEGKMFSSIHSTLPSLSTGCTGFDLGLPRPEGLKRTHQKPSQHRKVGRLRKLDKSHFTILLKGEQTEKSASSKGTSLRHVQSLHGSKMGA